MPKVQNLEFPNRTLFQARRTHQYPNPDHEAVKVNHCLPGPVYGWRRRSETEVEAISIDKPLLGLFELDEDGKVLYSSFETPEGEINHQLRVEGRDFFKDIARFANVEEFHGRFEKFRLMAARSSSFHFTCQYPEGPHDVQIVLARFMSDEGPTSFLVHFRKV